MLLQELDIALHGRLLVRIDIALVVVEVDVLHRLWEQFFLSGRRLSWRWGWRVHGDTRRGRLRPARSLCGQSIGGGISRSHALRPAGLHGAYAVDADISRIAGLPGQCRGPAFIDRTRVGRERSCRRGWRWGWRRWGWRYFLLARAQGHDRHQGEHQHHPSNVSLLHSAPPYSGCALIDVLDYDRCARLKSGEGKSCSPRPGIHCKTA